MFKNANNKIIARNITEALTLAVMVMFLVPLFLVLINAAKTNNEIIAAPLSLPTDWSVLFKNITTIWNNPNLRYSQALVNSFVITTFSLVGITIFSAMAAWVLLRTKTKLSTAILMLFIAAMVIPFQVVMFPLVKWFGIFQNQAVSLAYASALREAVEHPKGFGLTERVGKILNVKCCHGRS